MLRDDGCGFDEAAARVARADGHVGIPRLERAASMLGGHSTVASEDGETVARVRIPRHALAEQRRTEDELGAERRWSASLLAAIRDPFLVVRDARIVQANTALLDLTGFGSEEIVGVVVESLPFWNPAHRATNARRFERLARRSENEAILPMTRSDGSTFNAHWSIQVVEDGVGGDVGSLVVVRDLTDQERAIEQTQFRSELSATIETTRRLADVLDAARTGRTPMYVALGDLMTAHLGWTDVVLNVRRGDEWVVEWTSSSEAAVLLGERYDDDVFRPALDPRFAREGVFYSVEEEAAGYIGAAVAVGGPRTGTAPDSVRAGDLLLVPVKDRDGRPRAMISVDRPRSGRRPTTTQLQALSVVASHVGLAFELLDDTP